MIVKTTTFVTHEDIVLRYERLEKTLERLAGFGLREAGWDLGRGEPLTSQALSDARKVVMLAFSLGLWKSGAFASPSGSVLLAFTMAPHDIEVYVEGDGTFNYTHELAGEVVVDEEDITYVRLKELLEEASKNVCTSAQSTQTTIVTTPAVFEAPRSSHQAMAVYQYSGSSARKGLVVQSASTLADSTKTLQVPPHYFGFSQGRSSRLDLRAA